MRARRSVCLLLLVLGLMGVAAPLAAQLGDGDGDGVRDGLDLCPNERGPIANFGCASPRAGIHNAAASPTPPLAISGRVWNDRDGDGSQDADEPGLAGVPVELWDANRATRLYSVRTDGAGLYTLVAPAAGLFRVRVPPLAGTTLTIQDAGVTGDAVDSDVHTAGVDAGFSDVVGVTTAVAAAPRIDAGLRPPLTATPTPNLFNAQAAPALTLVLAPTAGPSATFGLDINLPVTMSPDEYQNQAATHLAALNNPPGQNRTPTVTRFPGPNMTQIAQWQTAVARQTLTAAPTVTGTLSATPTPTSSPTPTVTPTGTLATTTPTIDAGAMTAFARLGTQVVAFQTQSAESTRRAGEATAAAANQSILNTALAPTPGPSRTPLPFGFPAQGTTTTPSSTPSPMPFNALPAPGRTLVLAPIATPTPTALTFTGQIAPAVTLIGVLVPTPTADGSATSPLITPTILVIPSLTPSATASLAPPTPTTRPMAVNPVQGAAQAAITILPPRSSATPAAVQIQPDGAAQAVTPVAGEPERPDAGFDRDGDFIPDTLDACPDQPNQTPNGCPLPNLDRDGDGTLDYADACPDQPGDLTSRAHDMECPDTDNDGWTDNVDDCPDQPALLFGGCPAPPDRDGDGVLDNEDQCPDVRHESSSGCPDSDGDGLNDSGDACPNQPAPLSANGCPTADDRDGDAIPNSLDRCPDSFNLTLNGCPPGVSEFTPTPTPTITPASVDLTGPTPGLVFIPSPAPTATPIPQGDSPLDGAQAAIAIAPVIVSPTPGLPELGGGERITLTPSRTVTPIPPQAVNPVTGQEQATVSPSAAPALPEGSSAGGGERITLTPSPTLTPIPPQMAGPLAGAQAAVAAPLLPSATSTGLTFSGQAAPALTLALAISPTPISSPGVTPTPTLTPNFVFQPPIVRAPASLIWDPFSTSPLLSTRNLSFSDPNPPGSGAQLVVALSVANGELFTFDPVAGRLGGRRLVFDSTQELANLLAGVYYRGEGQAGGNVRLVLQAFYLRGLNDRSPTVTVEIALAAPVPTPPG